MRAGRKRQRCSWDCRDSAAASAPWRGASGSRSAAGRRIGLRYGALSILCVRRRCGPRARQELTTSPHGQICRNCAMIDPNQGFRITRCSRCGTPYFPPRLICHRCGSDTWTEMTLHEAVIEESTTVMHVAGAGPSKPRYLATVRADKGLRLIVGLEMPLPDGARVLLAEMNGAPVARPAQQPETRTSRSIRTS